jgi:hypothetical protein
MDDRTDELQVPVHIAARGAAASEISAHRRQPAITSQRGRSAARARVRCQASEAVRRGSR